MRRIEYILLIIIGVLCSQEPVDMVIICPSEFQPAYERLSEWKNKKGVRTIIRTLDDVEAIEIAHTIEGIFTDLEPDPKFVILGADVDLLPMLSGGSTMYGGFRSDWAFADITGDPLMDFYIGRLPAETLEEAEIMIEKIIDYERDGGPWMGKGVLIVNQDDDSDDAIYYANIDTARVAMERTGYTAVHELNDGMGDNDASDIHDAVSSGAGLVLYRGQATNNWYMPFAVDPYALDNHNMPTIVASITCNTITDFGSNYVDYFWMTAGTVDSTKGAVAFFGSTSSISGGAHLRAEISDGFIQSFFSDTTNDLGVAAEAGRLRVFETYSDTAQYTSHVLLGDPEMDIRTRQPSNLNISHTGVMITGIDNEFSVLVEDYDSGEPVENALICISNEELYERGYTNYEGELTLSINPSGVGAADIVVSAHNYIPAFESADIISDGPNLYVHSFRIVDEDDNDKINPGENVDLYLSIGNNGLEAAYTVSGSISSPWFLIDGSDFGFDRISPDEVVEISEPLSISLSPFYYRNDTVTLTTFLSDASGNEWVRASPKLSVARADIEFISAYLGDSDGDGDGNIDPGEGAKVIIRLFNKGDLPLNDVSIHAESMTDGVFVEDGFSAIEILPVDEEVRNLYDPLYLCHLPVSPLSSKADIRFVVRGESDFYEHIDTIIYSFELDGSQITGPDDYGYYCYDNTDTETGRAPTFYWMDISSVGDAVISVTNADDGIETIPLPFDFKYYGLIEDEISICSNGFITIGEDHWTGGSGVGHEQIIPHAGEASGMIAVFWDDLNPREAGDIFTHYDSDGHRFIIQYDEVGHYGYPSVTETFQIVLYDPLYYPTSTDDGIIDMLYHELTYPSTNTVGIENFGEDDGIQYVHWASYARNSEPLGYGRAIRYTTDRPRLATGWPVVSGFEIDDSEGGDGDGMIEGGETAEIRFWLMNIGEYTISSLIASPHAGSSFAHILSGEISVGDIPVGTESGPHSIICHFEPTTLNRTIELDMTLENDEISRYTTITVLLESPASISEINLPEQFSIEVYPNPFNSSLYISSPAGSVHTVRDISGRVIDRFEDNLWEPDISSGLYIITVENNGRKSSKRVFLIQ